MIIIAKPNMRNRIANALGIDLPPVYWDIQKDMENFRIEIQKARDETLDNLTMDMMKNS